MIDFTNLGELSPVFTDYTDWGCSQPLCNRMMDVIILLDESGSVAPALWAQEKAFVESIANSSNFSPELIRMGVVLVGTNAR